MARHMSNRARIERLQAEAAATSREKQEKAAKETAAPGRKRSKAKEVVPPRMKIVWTVCDPKGQVVKTYPYPLKPAAEAEAARLGEGHRVRDHRVPMDE